MTIAELWKQLAYFNDDAQIFIHNGKCLVDIDVIENNNGNAVIYFVDSNLQSQIVIL